MEFEILYFLQGLHQPLLDRLMVGITSLGNGGWFWIALTVLFLCLPKYRRCGITMAVALVLNFLICNVAVKNLVARERPCWIDPSVELLIPVPKDFSLDIRRVPLQLPQPFFFLLNARESRRWYWRR